MSIGSLLILVLSARLQAAGAPSSPIGEPVKTLPALGATPLVDAPAPLAASTAELGAPALPAPLAKPGSRIESAPAAESVGKAAAQGAPDSQTLLQTANRVYNLLNPNFDGHRERSLAAHPVSRFFERAHTSLRDPGASAQDVTLAARVAGKLAAVGLLRKDVATRRRLVAREAGRRVDLTAGWLGRRGPLHALYREILAHPNLTIEAVDELLRGLRPPLGVSARRPSLGAILSTAEQALFKLPADASAFVLLLQRMREAGSLSPARLDDILPRYARYAASRDEKFDPHNALDVYVLHSRPELYSEPVLLSLADADARLPRYLDPDFAAHILTIRFNELAAWAGRYLTGESRARVLAEIERKRAQALGAPNPTGI